MLTRQGPAILSVTEQCVSVCSLVCEFCFTFEKSAAGSHLFSMCPPEPLSPPLSLSKP